MGGSSSKQSKNTSVVQPSSSSTPVQNSPPHQPERPPTFTAVSTPLPLNISIDAISSSQNLTQGGMNKNFSTEMLITPGREESMYSKVAYTPQVYTHTLTFLLKLNFSDIFSLLLS
jgi:hypothetical protein